MGYPYFWKHLYSVKCIKLYQDDTNTHDNMLYHLTWYISMYTRTSFGPGFPLNNTRNVVQKKKNQELCRRAFLNPQGSLYYQPKHNMHFERGKSPKTIASLHIKFANPTKIHGWHLYNDPSSTFRSMFQGIAAKSAEKCDFWCKSSVRKSICSVTSPSRYDVALDPFKHGWWVKKIQTFHSRVYKLNNIAGWDPCSDSDSSF